jgi:hypothetical protein
MLRIVPGQPGLPQISLVSVFGIGVTLRIFLTGDAAHQPGIAAELLIQALE